VRDERSELGLKLRVGVFVIASLAVFLGLIYMLGARARLFEARYTIYAEFTEVGGLTEGATVRLAGVQIGRVTAVELPGQPGGKVRVQMSIAKRFSDRIRKNSIARIETQGLLGDKIVEITVGTAEAPAVPPGDVIASREPFDIGQVINESAQTVKNVATLAEALRSTAETLNQSKVIENASATVSSARRVTEQIGRIVDQVEKGNSWAHVLLYEEPVALRRMNELVMATERVVARIEKGEGMAGVLTSSESTQAGRKLVAAMERLAAALERPDSANAGLLPALLLDPKYKAVLEDVRALAHNLHDVSDRIAGGRGTLGSLVKDEPEDAGLRQASRDLQAAMANLKAITEKVNEGEGTIGALLADPTVYERLVAILDGAQRSFLLRGLLRGLGGKGETDGKGRKDKESASPR
jgi:phospholipid/cholesterol/gamma-HCH transport system substrate-binding protein